MAAANRLSMVDGTCSRKKRSPNEISVGNKVGKCLEENVGVCCKWLLPINLLIYVVAAITGQTELVLPYSNVVITQRATC